MSEIKKIIRQCVSDFNYLANRQIGVLESNDPDLGFIPWGGKDAEGNITVFLSKDKPGILSTLKITEIADGNAGIIQYDADGELAGLADLNLLADVEITDPSNLQGLVFNSDSSKWENQDIITYGLIYKGTWNADTNNPELSDAGGGGVKGDLYIVNVEGETEIDGISEWKVKDWIVNCGESWEKVDNTEIVYTFDLVYDNESGEHLITIDDGSMRWAIDGDYDFIIDLTDASASRGFKVYDASNSFSIIKEPLSSLYLIGNLYNVNIDSSHGSLYQSTSSPLQIRTLTSGDIYITSAGTIDIDAVSNIDIDGTGYFDVLVTGKVSIVGSGNSNFYISQGDLIIRTITSGSLIVTSDAGLFDLNAGANLDIDVTGTFDMLSTGAFSIDGTGASNVSATSGNLTISTITSGVLYLLSAGLFTLSDGFKSGSTYSTDLVLSDSNAEWNTFETNFGEVSLLNAINQCVPSAPSIPTLDQAYSASAGVSYIAIDIGNVVWYPTGANDFYIRVNDATDGHGFVVDHYIPPNGGTTHFSLLENTDQLSLTSNLGSFSLRGLSASTISTYQSNLSLYTENSGSLIATAAGLFDLNAGANLDIDVTGSFDMLSTGAFSIDGTGASNVSATSGNLTISTITSGVLYLLSAGLFTLSDGFKSGSTYSTDLVLSDSNAEWNTFEINFGEVSLLNAINQCVNGSPLAHASSHNAGGGDALAIDAVAGTGSLRTLGTTATSACAGNDSRLSDSRTPTAHKTSHQSGGSDAIKLDDLSTPDDNTDLNASTSAHGLLKKLSNVATEFLNGQGNFATPSGSTRYSAEMYMNANSTALTNETANTPILSRLWTTGTLNGWTFVAGTTGAITAYSNYGGTVAGTVRAASTAHGLSTGDIISIRGTTNYNGVFQITKISNDAFYFYNTWVSDDGASDWDKGAYLLAGASAAGTYKATWTLSMNVTVFQSSNVIPQLYVNATACNKCRGKDFIGTDGECEPVSGQSLLTIVSGDKVFLAVTCSNANANPVLQYGSVILTME